MKTVKVRWNGGKDDPDSITQYGVTFNKGEWTDVPHRHDEYKVAKEAGRFHRTAKLESNPAFEVKGFDYEPDPVAAGAELPQANASGAPARAPATIYSVSGDKKKGFIVVDAQGNAVQPEEEPYKTELDAQNVADALNEQATQGAHNRKYVAK